MPKLPQLLLSRLPIGDLGSFCRRHPIQEMWVFGSVLDDWRPDSDVDLAPVAAFDLTVSAGNKLQTGKSSLTGN